MSDLFVGIQINATSFQDEGIEPVLDILQERAKVNALLLATPCWTRGVGGRVTPGHPIPDHGGQEYDFDWWGGDYARSNPAYFGKTCLGPPPRAPEYPDFDLIGDVLPLAKSRGMKSYAWIDESSYIQAVRDIPNMPKCLEVDIWNRPSTRPCFNNPDYRNWWLAIVESYVKSYAIDGIAFCSERPGPLNTAIQGPVAAEGLTCFCTHCRQKGRERGIDVARAQQGLGEVLAWSEKIAAGDRHSDGAFVAFWRILVTYPEVLAWQALWADSQQQLYRDIYGVAKASNAYAEVGWHIYHNNSFNPFYRADQDYARYAQFSDFLKVVAYNNAAGPRFAAWLKSATKALFADFTPHEIYPFMQKVLGIQEAALDDLSRVGFSADYVRGETARAVRSAGATRVYTGIDVDIPVGTQRLAEEDRAKRFEGNMGGRRGRSDGGWDKGDEGELSVCTPESVKAATLAAFEGGASGIVISRKYSEMFLGNLGGVGAALTEMGR